ncbi:MAG: tetratricopeptide repeat protein [Pseudomonadota bacterium]|nr:tetratricopeptide repeat protein [Pseudomonadota bacterium]
MARDQRRLAAIISADVVGYSLLMGRDDSATLAEMKAQRRELIDPKIAEYGGRIVKTTGDGLLLEFPSVVDALRCAVDVQRGIAERNVSVPPQQRIEWRIGVNVGDIIIDDDDIFGDGVNVAARLQTLAEPGGICVSRVVRDQVLDKLSFAFHDLGPQQVKNISRPVEVFRVYLDSAAMASSCSTPRRWRGMTRSPRRWIATGILAVGVASTIAWLLPQSLTAGLWYKPSPAAVIPDAGPLSIVVLPFQNLTGDATQEYVADGLTANVTADLTRIREAFIVNAASAFAYKDKPVTAQRVGHDLGVHFVLQGSVQRSGTKFRVNAQFADTVSNAQLWSENFEGDQSDLFALQDRVTTIVGNSIGREMVIVAARDSETRKSSPKVADLILRAKALELKPRSLKNEQQEEDLYRQALELEPNNARVMVYLAGSLTLQPDNFGSQMDESVREKKYSEGRELALKARELDPDNPRVYTVLGVYALNHGDFHGAQWANETLLSLEPKNPGAYINLAKVFIAEGEPNRAIELLTQAVQLRPKHTHEFTLLLMGFAYFMRGENDAAIEWLLKSLGRNSTYPPTHAYLAMAYALKGQDAKARAESSEVRRLDAGMRPTFIKPSTSSPAAYKDFYDNKLIPAWRKAGLPE